MRDVNELEPRALLVTIADGPELLPDAAFAAALLRRNGFRPERLATDFCTSQDAFQSRLRADRPSVVIFFDGAEWREIIDMLARFAAGVVPATLVVTGDSLARDQGGGRRFASPLVEVPRLDDETLRAWRADLGASEPHPPTLDYALFGGADLLRRGMGCSLFGDPGTAALLARRGSRDVLSPAAMLARLEGTTGSAGIEIPDEAALAPLGSLGNAATSVEWWDRRFPIERDGLLRQVAATGRRQSVRLAPGDATPARLADLAGAGVTRVIFDCDVASDATPRLPGAQASALDVAAAVARARTAGLGSGVLFVIGLPGETATVTEARTAVIRRAAPERLRVVPFEPTGFTPAFDECCARGWWPPADNRWNRELYQPLNQPELGLDNFPAVMEVSLALLAGIESHAGAVR